MTELVVSYENREVGVLSDLGTGVITFGYSAGWTNGDRPTPLSVSMPIAGQNFRGAVVENYLRGLLPDDPDVVRRWAREADVSPASTIDVLAHVGEDLPGAISISSRERPDRGDRSGAIEWLSEAEVAESIATVRADHTAWHAYEGDERWSLAGAQPKLALHQEAGQWGRTSGRSATTHILKPGIRGLVDHDLNEHICMAAAGLLGLSVAPTEIASFGDERVVVVERYDRIVNDRGTTIRLHQEDMCQALGVQPSLNYQNEGGPSPEAISALLRSVIPSPQAADLAVTRFVDALAYNWIIGGTDAHAKNYSLLLDGEGVLLAPLYDVSSILPYRSYAPKAKLAMKIGSEYRLGALRRSSWERLATSVGLPVDAVLTRVLSLIDRTPDAIASVGTSPNVRRFPSDLPARLTNAVADHAKDCARQLALDTES